jgi:phage portal protein BeeE
MPNIFQRTHVAFKALTGIFSDNRFTQVASLLNTVSPKSTPPKRSTQSYLKAYSEMPWLYAVASRVATSVSAIQWKAFSQQRMVNGQKRFVRNRVLQCAPLESRQKEMLKLRKAEELVEIENNPLLDLFDAPNPIHNSMSMKSLTQLHLDLTGEAFLLKQRGMRGMVERLWVIPPHWINRLPTQKEPWYELKYQNAVEKVPDSEMLFMAHPNPEDPYGRGVGICQAISDELETDEYAGKHTKQFFWNNARPDLLVYPKGQTETGARVKWDSSEMRRLEVDWRNKVQGFFKSWAPYFVPQELGVHEFTQNFRNLQLVPLRQFERDTILQVWGIPPEIMGIIENSNRATIESSFYLFCLLAILPRLEFQRASYQERLAPEFDERIILGYDSPIDADKEFQTKVAMVAPWMLKQHEWRELGGFEPSDDGEELHVLTPGQIFTDNLEEHMANAAERSEEMRQNLLNTPPPPPSNTPSNNDERNLETFFAKRLNLEGLDDAELWTLDSILASQ